MEYQLLTAAQRYELTLRRVAELEADHYRNVLVLAETSNPDEAAAIMDRQAEIERRITVHGSNQTPTREVVPAEEGQ